METIANSLLQTLELISTGDANPNGDQASVPYLKWMCLEILEHPNNPNALHSIGYIQGILVGRGLSQWSLEQRRIQQADL